MSKLTHAHIEQLLREIILPFYHVKRTIPIPVGERRRENDAEHSWSLALLACSLAPHIDDTLDIGKVCQFAIAHDLVEVYAGDTSPFGGTDHKISKTKREANALKRITKDFAHFPWIVQTITAYEHKDTPEAKFVYALDKYIAISFDYIDQGKFFKERQVTLDDYNKTLQSHRQKAHTHAGVAKYYDELRNLLDAHPEFFHQESAA